ncbi:hypothetical protein HK097_002139, partial [Rhizophlyctis rosea]
MPFEIYTSLPHSRTPSQTIQALSKFTTQYSTATSFVPNGVCTQEEKRVFVEQLLRGLSSNLEERRNAGTGGSGDSSGSEEEEATRLTLESLRILCRESLSCSQVYSSSGISLLLSHSTLPLTPSPSPSSSSPTQATFKPDSQVTIESLKVLSNCLLQNPQSRRCFEELGGVEGVVGGLGLDPTKLNLTTQFLLLRLLFLTTVDNKHTVAKLVEALGVVDVIEKIIKKHTPKPIEPGPFTPQTVLSEALKLVFNLMHDKAPSSKIGGGLFGGAVTYTDADEEVVEGVKPFS